MSNNSQHALTIVDVPPIENQKIQKKKVFSHDHLVKNLPFDFQMLCSDYGLSNKTRFLLEEISYHAGKSGKVCSASNITMGLKTRLSERQVSRNINTLVKKGLIKVFKEDDSSKELKTPVTQLVELKLSKKGNFLNTHIVSTIENVTRNCSGVSGVPITRNRTDRYLIPTRKVLNSLIEKKIKGQKKQGYLFLGAGDYWGINVNVDEEVVHVTDVPMITLIRTIQAYNEVNSSPTTGVQLTSSKLSIIVGIKKRALRDLINTAVEKGFINVVDELNLYNFPDRKTSTRKFIVGIKPEYKKMRRIIISNTEVFYEHIHAGQFLNHAKNTCFCEKTEFSKNIENKNISKINDLDPKQFEKTGGICVTRGGQKCLSIQELYKITSNYINTGKTSVEVGSLLQESSRQGESCNGNYIDNLFTNPLSPWKVTNKIVPPRAQRKSENKCLTKVIKIDYNKKMKSRKNKSNTRTSKPAVQTGGGNVEQILTTGMDTIQKRGADVISLREAKREKKRIEISTRTDETKTKTKTKIENRRGVGLCEAGLMQGMLSQYDNTDVKPPHIARWSIKQKAKAKNIIKHFPDTGDMASFFEFCGSRWQKVFSDKIEWFNNGVVPNTSIDILATLAIADIFMVEWQASLLTQTEQIDKQLHTRKQKQATYPDNALTTDNKSETNTNTAETSKKRLERKLEWEEMNTFDMVEYLELRANSIQYYHPKIFHLISNFNNALGRRLLKVYIQKFKEQTGQQPKFSKFSPQATCKHHIAFVKGELSDEQSIKLGFL